jgi:hypothetical protein
LKAKKSKYYNVAKNSNFQQDIMNGSNLMNDQNSGLYKRHLISKRKNLCSFCKALMWAEEKTGSGPTNENFSLCCAKGKVDLETPWPLPQSIYDLLTTNSQDSKNFRDNIRLYNSVFAFATMNTKVDKTLANKTAGIYTFRINGVVYRTISHLNPNNINQAKFSQIYILDSDDQLKRRKDLFADLDDDILRKLQSCLDEVNPFTALYKSVGTILKENPYMNLNLVMKATKEHDKRRYNMPTAPELAVILPGEGDAHDPASRDIIIENSNGSLINIKESCSVYDPLHYVLMFPYGQLGWQHKTIPHKVPFLDEWDNNSSASLDRRELTQESVMDSSLPQSVSLETTSTKSKFVSCMQFYAYMLMQRPGAYIHLFGRLFLEYCVDNYAKMESERLNYIRFHQKEIRVEQYKGLTDAMQGDSALLGRELGRNIVLPSTFINSPRNMHQLYQDAMAVVRAYGKPDLFLTFTCNPLWPEITSELQFSQTAADRPDLVARVFSLKLNSLMHDIMKLEVFGEILALIYTIEFQKRGLPHAHILVILHPKDKPKTPEDFDKIVSAEIPDTILNPAAYETVVSCMMHGPCGIDNPKAPCMDGNKCTKKYPKKFIQKTVECEDGYPMYRRRQDGKTVTVKNFKLDNTWVVPHNLYLATKYNAHINVEICSSISAVKYLYKYVYKGHDRAAYIVTVNNGSITDPSHPKPIDEINNYLDARYVSASEACWRLFHFPLHKQHPNIVRLAIHLPGEEVIAFDETELILDIVGKHPFTTLTGYFKINTQNANARLHYYHDIPKFFTWNKSKKENKWKERKYKKDTVGRLYFVNPSDTERFCLRLLLTHIKGAKSFDDLATIDGVKYKSFKEAAIALHLLENDNEYDDCLTEAISILILPSQLRNLFVSILINCEPREPGKLWVKHKNHFINDFIDHNPNPNFVEQLALKEIDLILRDYGKTLADYTDMPQLTLIEAHMNKLILLELKYDRLEQAAFLCSVMSKLNVEQLMAFQTIKTAAETDDDSSKVFFLDGPGGTGKTFLYNAILAHFRANGDIAIPVASSGIAALLLKGGRTAHSRFKIPIDINEASTCFIARQSDLAELIKITKVFIWDECPMVHKHVIEAVDRTLRDIMSSVQQNLKTVPFGGKVFLFGGDYRQILAVILRGARNSIVSASLKFSYLWPHIKKLKLTINMRVMRGNMIDEDLKNFAEFLLSVGEGTVENQLPIQYSDAYNIILNLKNETPTNIDEFIANVFPNLNSNNPDDFIGRAVLCARNEDVSKMNDYIVNQFPGASTQYLSTDKCIDDNHNFLYSPEFLNTIDLPNLPPHKLNLKQYQPIICLRNLDPANGLCNGTRLLTIRMHKHLICAKIICGEKSGETVFIPRLTITPSQTGLPFDLSRRQFPVRSAFAMTINKAQGQTLSYVGLFLANHVFTHGQLYVGLSRVTSPDNLVIYVEPEDRLSPNSVKVQNVVYHEIFNE